MFTLSLSLAQLLLAQPFLGASPGLAELPEAGGNLCRHITERHAVFEPSDMSSGKGVDFSPELPDLVQLSRFVLFELWLDVQKLTCCQERGEANRESANLCHKPHSANCKK